MEHVMIGTDGGLCLNEQMQIQGSFLPGGAKVEPFSLYFALGTKRKAFRLDRDFKTTLFKRIFLGACYKLADERAHCRMKVTACTPFDLDEDAHLSAAVFEFKIKNTSKKQRRYSFGVCMQNPLEEPLHRNFETDCAKAVLLSSAHTIGAQMGCKNYCVFMQGATGSLRYTAYSDDGSFLFEESGGNVRDGAAALVSDFKLEGGETKLLQVIVSWHMPYMQFETDSAESLCLKNGYATRFENAYSVSEYVSNHLFRLTKMHDSFSEVCRDLFGNGGLSETLAENFSAVLTNPPLMLPEIGKGKAFYKNAMKAPILFAQNDKLKLWSDAFAFDLKTEEKLVEFLLLSCLDTADGLLTLPEICEGSIRYESVNLDNACICLMILRIYRLWKKSGSDTDLGKYEEKIKWLWNKMDNLANCAEEILYYCASVCLNEMLPAYFKIDLGNIQDVQKSVLSAGSNFSVMGALWIAKALGICPFAPAEITLFLEDAYLQLKPNGYAGADLCAYVCLLFEYGRHNVASAVCKSFGPELKAYLIGEKLLFCDENTDK